MSITATQLKSNLGFYLEKSVKEDIYITKNGKVISKLTNPYQSRVDSVDAIFGVIKGDLDEEEIREERLKKI